MSQELLYWQALNRAMDAEMEADESVFTLGEDVGLYGGSYRVTERLFANTVSGGCATRRYRKTVLPDWASGRLSRHAAGSRDHDHQFRTAGLDSIVNAAAKIPFMSGRPVPMPLVVRVPSGIARQLGAQHAQRLESMFMNVRFARCCTIDAAGCLLAIRQAIASDEPIILLEHELLYFTKGSVDTLADPPPMHRATRFGRASISLSSGIRGRRCRLRRPPHSQRKGSRPRSSTIAASVR